MTKNFDSAVKPVPILQTINLIIGIISLVYEWPLKYVAGTSIQQSMEVRLMWLPLASLSSLLLYQATNPALYYFIAIGVYFWAYTEGEVSSSYYHQLCSNVYFGLWKLMCLQVICAVPWTLPRKMDRRRLEKA